MTQNLDDQEDTEDQAQQSPDRITFPDGSKGILSDSDRGFLLDDDPTFPEMEWDGSNENQKRWRLREKVKQAFHDFRLLNELSRKEKWLIFRDNRESFYGSDQPENRYRYSNGRRYLKPVALAEQYDHLQEVVMSLCEGCLLGGPRFEQLLEDALERFVLRATDDPPDIPPDVNVKITVGEETDRSEPPDIEDLEAKLEQGKRLTYVEVGILFLERRIDNPRDLSPENFPH